MPKGPADYRARELLEIRRTLGWMDLVIGSIADAVYVVDEDRKLVFTNQYFSDLVGSHRVFLLGHDLEDVFKPNSIVIKGGEYAGINPSNDDGKHVYIGEWTNRDGISMTFKISSQLLSSTRQTVFLAQDITYEFETSVMKSKFMDLASHQLRTPLTAISTYTYMLNDGYAGPLNDKQQQLVETIIHSTERMNQLVDGLLDITRIQNEGRVRLVEDIDLAHLLSTVHHEFLPRLNKKHIQFRLKFPQKDIRLTSDPTALKEIFSNLLDNALRYTPERGHVSIEVSTHKDHVCVRVQDNGIGIPKDEIPQLFKQFSRANNALEINPEGTGLGLYMIKLLLDRIGGGIKIDSQLGEGTAFTVTLPKQNLRSASVS